MDGAGGQATADKVRKALTEGDMARPPELGRARRVMQDVGVRTWEQYLDKVRKGEIWGRAREVGRWPQSKGCRIAMSRDCGPKGVYRKMAQVGEGKRTAAALLWSRRGGRHYELLWLPEEEEAEAVAEAKEEDGNESAGKEEAELEVELEEERQRSGRGARRAGRGASVAGCAPTTDLGERRGMAVPGAKGSHERRGRRWGRAPHVTGNYEQDWKEC